MNVDRDTLLAAARRPIEPVRCPVGYRWATGGVALLMVILPAIYLTLIGWVGYGVIWHLVSNTGWLSTEGRVSGFMLLVYLAPAVIGGIVVAFMLRPLFVRHDKEQPRRTLLREDEPLLYAFVDALCSAVGAPPAAAIQVDVQVNAAAMLTSSVFNPFRRELVLVIGLPLVAGMDLAQLSGVLAHEFGHFSQGASMRLGAVIQRINRWFALVVCERDTWDENLKEMVKDGDLRITWMIWIARGMIWLTQRLLYGLMLLGMTMSARLSREQEFDADQHEIRYAGSAAFAESFGKLQALALGNRKAMALLATAFKERRLADNLVELICDQAEQLAAEERQALQEAFLEGVTERFDTHPCDKDRVARAEQMALPGVFGVDAPASVLFRDFEHLCQRVSQDFYEHVWEAAARGVRKVPAREILAHYKALEDRDRAMTHVLSDLYSHHWSLPFARGLAAAEGPVDPILLRIRELHGQLAGQARAHGWAIDDLEHQQGHQRECAFAELLLKGHVGIDRGVFHTPMTTLAEVVAARTRLEAGLTKVQRAVTQVAELAIERIWLSLSLLGHPAVQERLPDAGRWWAEAQDLLAKGNALQGFHEAFLRAQETRELMWAVSRQLEASPGIEGLFGCLREAAKQGANFLQELAPTLSRVPYPFDHAEGAVSLAHYLVPEVPPSDNPGSVFSGLSHVALEGPRLITRVVGCLCILAEQLETALAVHTGAPGEVSEA